MAKIEEFGIPTHLEITCPACGNVNLAQVDSSLYFTWKLNSGVVLDIFDRVDWHTFGEVFLNKCYEPAVNLLSTVQDIKVTVYDLGANTGMFSTYMLDRSIRKKQIVNITAVEANPATFNLLNRRMQIQKENISSGSCVRLMNKLVGLQAGDSELFIDTHHVMASTKKKHDTYVNSVISSYVDLETLDPLQSIDLIKCDIEGSELDFVNTYAKGLLRRTKVFICELHADICDIPQLNKKIEESEFSFCEELDRTKANSVKMWWRQ